MNPWTYGIVWVVTGYVGFFLLMHKGYSLSSSMEETEELEVNEARGVIRAESFHGATYRDLPTHIGYGVLPMILGPCLLIAGLLLPRKHKP